MIICVNLILERVVDTMIIKKIFMKLKNFLSIPRNLIIVIVLILALLAAIVILLFSKKGGKGFVLDGEFDTYPQEVRELYTNMVSVSCMGDMYFNIKSNDGVVDIKNIDKKLLLNYMFSYLEKNSLLGAKDLATTVINAEKTLFENELDLIDNINSFEYKGNVYDFTGKNIDVVKGNCKNNEISYVTFLCGYFSYEGILYMDVDIGYLKNGLLYGLDNRELGEYDGDVSKLEDLMETASYYRIGYKQHGNNDYRLLSIELRDRV